jgi:hypothetical protein
VHPLHRSKGLHRRHVPVLKSRKLPTQKSAKMSLDLQIVQRRASASRIREEGGNSSSRAGIAL